MLLPQGVYHCPHQAIREDPIRDRRGTYSKLKLWKANPSIRAFRRPSRANRHRLDLHYLRYGLDVEMCEISSTQHITRSDGRNRSPASAPFLTLSFNHSSIVFY
jgi:hypothetical protein